MEITTKMVQNFQPNGINIGKATEVNAKEVSATRAFILFPCLED